MVRKRMRYLARQLMNIEWKKITSAATANSDGRENWKIYISHLSSCVNWHKIKSNPNEEAFKRSFRAEHIFLFVQRLESRSLESRQSRQQSEKAEINLQKLPLKQRKRKLIFSLR